MDENPQHPLNPRTPATLPQPHIDPSPRSTTFHDIYPAVDGYDSSSEGLGNDEEELEHKNRAKEAMSKLMNGKDKEWAAVVEKPGPLRLLDLPLDILKEIVKEVTHTNDLTALALSHSVLHQLAIPHIYSRFDIVWPDSETHAEPRSGVDALTYGLATLVFAEDVFGEAPSQNPHPPPTQTSTCSHCGHVNQSSSDASNLISNTFPRAKRRRRGNHYAEYTRKFSLGNGPPDWVKEYMITKEGGKMLGTLVALAVARMKNLETFVWDMPTGVLRDVWIALSSLGERDDGQDCRLEKVWIRWHNNHQQLEGLSSPAVASAPAPLFGHSTQPGNHSHVQVAIPPLSTAPTSYLDRVERPTFSILPPLKSLTVLDIDELAYLDEMSALIGNSKKCLRELRVGIAPHVANKDWVAAWQGEGAEQWDTAILSATYTTRSERRVGGIIGTLVGQCFDDRDCECSDLLRCRFASSPMPYRPPPSVQEVVPDASMPEAAKTVAVQAPRFVEELSPLDEMSTAKEKLSIPRLLNPDITEDATDSKSQDSNEVAPRLTLRHRTKVFNMLQLRVLELERVPLSVRVLGVAIDWMKLTDLTLLSCQNHEQLWKLLRKAFAPLSPSSSALSSSKGNPTDSSSLQYRLNLRKIQTDQVSSALITFLKETLAPNTLEVLFLQQNRMYSSSVTIDSIYRGPIRRHRSSLQKILIDSSYRSVDGRVTDSPRWSNWMLTRDIVGFLTSGKMANLRELGASLDYRDWHFFLQRLPAIPHIRSLYLPFIGDHAHGSNLDPRELAMQIVDIVTLCPEIELCYTGILTKCFEILEYKAGERDTRLSDFDYGQGHPAAQGPTVPEEDDDEEDDGGDDDEGDDGDDDEGAGDGEATDDEDTETEDGDAGDGSESDTEGDLSKVRLRLREILFYDDKVAVFKARHGRL